MGSWLSLGLRPVFAQRALPAADDTLYPSAKVDSPVFTHKRVRSMHSFTDYDLDKVPVIEAEWRSDEPVIPLVPQ